MTPFLDSKLPAIRELCARHHVRSLYAFGSVIRDDFGPDSDIDLMVDFEPIASANSFRRFFDIKDELELLLERPVDLITSGSISNPFFKQEIDSTKAALYAA